MQPWRSAQCFQELVKPSVFCAAPTQSFSQVSLCTPFPSVGWLKGHIFQAPVTLPLSQKVLSGSFCWHCHHWLHSQPILTWPWECCSTCMLEVPNQRQCLGTWGIKTRKLCLVDAKLPMVSLLWKISLKQRNQNSWWWFDFWQYWSRFCTNTLPWNVAGSL